MDAFLRIGYLVSLFLGVMLWATGGVVAAFVTFDPEPLRWSVALWFLQAIALKPR